MTIDVPLLLWTLISFAVFWFLLDMILFRPVLRVMRARKQKVMEGIEAGRAAEESLRSKREEGERMLEACRAEFAAREKEMLAGAESEAGRRLAAAREEEEKRYLEETERIRADRAACEAALDSALDSLTELAADTLSGGDG